MKKRRLLLGFFLLILALLMAILFLGPWTGAGRTMRQLVPGDVSKVDRIVLSDAYHSTDLVKGDSSWLLFGTEAVDPVAVENLLIASGRLEVSAIVEHEESLTMNDQRSEARTITYYRGDRVLLSYVLKAVSGRFMLIPPNSPSAFYVTVPGYPGLDLGRVFSATPDHYRQHLLIDLLPSEISVIEIQLASGEAFRFIQDHEGNVRCEAGNDQTRVPEGEADELALKLLFSYFTSIRYEQRSGIAADSLAGAAGDSLRMASIGLESFEGEHHLLQVYAYHEADGSGPHLFRALVLHNEEQDAIFVNYIYLDVLMRDLSHYFGEK